MKISSKGRYALRVMVDIASSQNNFISLSEIAERQNISIKYLEQIISKLLKAKLLKSARGALGGYKLTKSPDKYKISEILSITNDMPELVPCLKNNSCPKDLRDKCTTIECWQTLTKLICDYLDSITLEDLINKSN